MELLRVETKINWDEVAKRVSILYGKTVHKGYCRDLYNGHHNSPKLLKIIKKVISEAKQEALK